MPVGRLAAGCPAPPWWTADRFISLWKGLSWLSASFWSSSWSRRFISPQVSSFLFFLSYFFFLFSSPVQQHCVTLDRKVALSVFCPLGNGDVQWLIQPCSLFSLTRRRVSFSFSLSLSVDRKKQTFGENLNGASARCFLRSIREATRLALPTGCFRSSSRRSNVIKNAVSYHLVGGSTAAVGSTTECPRLLGLSSGSIQDWQIASSSHWTGVGESAESSSGGNTGTGHGSSCQPKYARLYQSGSKAWCAKHRSVSEWILVDLGVISQVSFWRKQKWLQMESNSLNIKRLDLI